LVVITTLDSENQSLQFIRKKKETVSTFVEARSKRKKKTKPGKVGGRAARLRVNSPESPRATGRNKSPHG